MAITYPYTLAAFANRLRITAVRWDIQRHDELSGSGDARFWQAELADPLWKAEVELDVRTAAEIEQMSALIRKLQGAQECFMLHAPQMPAPQADPTGTILGAATVQVHSVGTQRRTLRLKGLPAGYQLTLADKGQVAFSDPVQNYFFEFSENIAAAGTGITPEVEVFPHVPVGVVANNAVTLIKPAARMFIMPGSHNPGRIRGMRNEGAAFTAMERRR